MNKYSVFVNKVLKIYILHVIIFLEVRMKTETSSTGKVNITRSEGEAPVTEGTKAMENLYERIRRDRKYFLLLAEKSLTGN
jgi:large-conductance mechanosensitive channel